ncbi:hypothetical protein ABKV53_19160 [Enterobacter cloacae]|uniref:hypothetical protein n=1 Tax=Enterobacter cloacae TaxID=550 RepID=UPI0032AF5C57
MDRLVFFEGIENPRVLGSIPSPGTTFLFLRILLNLFRKIFRKLPEKLFPADIWLFIHPHLGLLVVNLVVSPAR